MRNTLEDLYYGNITPGAQQMAPNSELKRATDRVARFESQLTERLDEDGQLCRHIIVLFSPNGVPAPFQRRCLAHSQVSGNISFGQSFSCLGKKEADT